MQDAVTRTSASVGCLMTESGTSSTRTSPAPYRRVARIRCSPVFVGAGRVLGKGKSGIAAGSGGLGAGEVDAIDVRDGGCRGAAGKGDGGDEGQRGDDGADH